MAQIFLLLIAASLVPVCIPLVRRRQLSRQFWTAIGAMVFSACLQTIFVICVDRNVVTLDYSHRFATVGVTACVLEMVMAKTSTRQLATGRDNKRIDWVDNLGNSGHAALVTGG